MIWRRILSDCSKIHSHHFNTLRSSSCFLNHNIPAEKHLVVFKLLNKRSLPVNVLVRNQSGNERKLSNKEKIKNAVAAYGSTVIVFHVTISLLSLGMCYLLISSGLDVEKIFVYFGFENISNKLATSTGTFVAAYAVHKLFAPVRIGITLTATPFVVRYLRNVGILKKPVTSALKTKNH